MNTTDAEPGRLQQTFAEMAAPDVTISRALAASPETVVTSAFSDVLSVAACAAAAFTAASISARVGATAADWDAASFDTVATAALSAVICPRRVAAAAGTFAAAAVAVAAPDRVTVRPEATREQLRDSMGYAAARTAFSPLRATAVPDADEARSASSVAFDFSTRDRAANASSAAARAGSVVGGGALVVDADVVDVEDVLEVVDGVVEDVLGGVEPPFELHAPRRQTTTAVVTIVLRCMARTPHHFVRRAPAPSSHPVMPMSAISADRANLSRQLTAGSSDWLETTVTPGDCARRARAAATVLGRAARPPARRPRPQGERGMMNSRRAVGRLLSPVLATVRRQQGMVPGYLVVGTKRGGSTSIAHWISQHPEVAPCRSNKGTHYFDVNHGRGWSWYLSRFPAATAQQWMTGEASPYYMFHPLAPGRMAAELPDVKLIVSLREPVARAWSHHQYETQQGHEDKSFPEALALEDERLAGEAERLRSDPSYESHAHRHHAYLRRGHYAEQIERLYEFFDPSQVLVLRSESMFTDPHGELKRVWDHLGVAPVRLDGLDRLKATHRPLDIEPALARELDDHYRPWNDRLAQLPGVGFTWPDNTTRGDA